MATSRKRTETARVAALNTAFSELQRLAANSDLIKVQPVRQIAIDGWPVVDAPAGWPPELYLVTYRCTGFTALHANGEPIPGDFHQMGLYLPKEYPALEPKLAWMTPIWHPNIQHDGLRHVCTDAPETHRALRPLSDLLVFIGEMVQYKRYHAKHMPPWPLDQEVAKWVLEVAEPKGWVGPHNPLDSRPLVRPLAIRAVSRAAAASKTSSTPPARKISFGAMAKDAAEAANKAPARIRFGSGQSTETPTPENRS